MSIDDERMEALDEALSVIFQRREEKVEKKKQKKSEATSNLTMISLSSLGNKMLMMHFKMRLLCALNF